MKTRLIHIFLLMGLLVCPMSQIFGQGTEKIQTTTVIKCYAGDTAHPPCFPKPANVPASQTVYTTYDEAPVPPGGQQGYEDFLKQNIKYPKEAIDAKVSGNVYLSIIIDITGKLSDVHVEKDNVHHGCGEEAVRVVKMMPPWKPGKMKGKPVKVRYVIPVKFELSMNVLKL